MEKLLCAMVLALLCGAIIGDPSDYTNVKLPWIYVYSMKPLKMGEENLLACHYYYFQSPRITLKLKKDGKEIPDGIQFGNDPLENWNNRVTKLVKFTHQPGVKYTCEVQHNDGSVKSALLESLM